MVNCVCAKTVPHFIKVRLIKDPKSKFPRGVCPQTPLVCHMLCTWIHTCLPNNPYNFILLPPLGKKLKETLLVVFFFLFV